MTAEASLGADGLVHVEDHAGILLLRLNAPPANALTRRLRQSLADALGQAAKNPVSARWS